MSFRHGVVPLSWLTAIITPVPKVPKPAALSEYRPISVTPLLSRLAEKLVVSRWLVPALRQDDIQDQFGFRLTWSTTAALIFVTHIITKMLERCMFAVW